MDYEIVRQTHGQMATNRGKQNTTSGILDRTEPKRILEYKQGNQISDAPRLNYHRLGDCSGPGLGAIECAENKLL